MLERDRNAHRFTLSNALKDVTYLAGFAQALGVANPVGAAVRNRFAQAVATGDGAGLRADAVGSCRGVERHVAGAAGVKRLPRFAADAGAAVVGRERHGGVGLLVGSAGAWAGAWLRTRAPSRASL